MKKIMVVALALCLIVGIAPAAHADVIAEPDFSFFGRHSDEMEYLYRSFYANGPEGYIVGWDEPEGRVVEHMEINGTIILITYTISWNGTEWGTSQYNNAWIRMDELVAAYDYVSFEEEHGASFHPYNGDLQSILDSNEIFIWAYPGAAEPITGIQIGEGDAAYIKEIFRDTAYTDSDGRTWLFLRYLFSWDNVWLCIDDPANPALPANPAPMPDLIPPVADIYEVTIQRRASWNEISTFVLIGAMVLMVIAVTVLLIRLLGGRQK